MKPFLKIIGYLSLGLIAILLVYTGVTVFILKDDIQMTGGSCKTLFANLKSDDPDIKIRAHRYLKDAVRMVKDLDNISLVDETVYSETVNELKRICDENPEKNLLQIQLSYIEQDK